MLRKPEMQRDDFHSVREYVEMLAVEFALPRTHAEIFVDYYERSLFSPDEFSEDEYNTFVRSFSALMTGAIRVFLCFKATELPQIFFIYLFSNCTECALSVVNSCFVIVMIQQSSYGSSIVKIIPKKKHFFLIRRRIPLGRLGGVVHIVHLPLRRHPLLPSSRQPLGTSGRNGRYMNGCRSGIVPLQTAHC